MTVDLSRPAQKRGTAGSVPARAASAPVDINGVARQVRDGLLADQRQSLFWYYRTLTLHVNAPGMFDGSLFSGQQGFNDEADGC